MNLPIKTIADIRSLLPCYDPSRYLPEDWQGTALDILKVTDCPAQDRLFVVLQEGWIDHKILRLFAAWVMGVAPEKVIESAWNAAGDAAVAEAAPATKEGFEAWKSALNETFETQLNHLVEMLEAQ